MTSAPSALRADGRSRSAGSGPPRGPVSWSSSRGTSCGCPASERSPPRYRWTSTTQGGSRACSDANPFSRPTLSSARVSADHLVGRALRDVRCGRSSVVHARPRQRLRTGVDRAPPPGKTNPGPRHRAGDAGDEPREARVRRDRDRHLVERDQEGEGRRESRGPYDRVSRGRHPDVEASGWLRRRHHRPGRVSRPSAGETVGVCGHRPPDPPAEWMAPPEVLLGQAARDVRTIPDFIERAPWTLREEVRDPFDCGQHVPGDAETESEDPARDIPPEQVVGPRRGAAPNVLEPRTKPFDQVPIADVRRDGLVDAARGHVEDALGPGRPGSARCLRDERDRVRLEVETILPLALVDLCRVAEEAAIMEDLIEVSDERAAVAEVQELLLEFFDERLHLGDPLVAMTADAEQFAFRREAEVFFDEEELVGSASAALDELVHAVPRGVHQRRRRAVDQIAGGEQIPTRRRELLPIEDPEDRPEDIVAPHVRRAVERIEDDREPPTAEILHLSHFLRGDLGDEVRFAARVHEEVIHPDVEFELLLPVRVPGRRGIPPNRQLPPDSAHQAGEPAQQEAEIAVDFSGVLRERDVGPAASLST